MRIIIPVAGVGTRLRPHTHSLPKPLIRVAGKPIIAHVLDPVVPLEPEEVIFVVGYKGDQIRDYVTTNYQFKTKFVQQDKLLGLGYAMNLAVRDIEDGEVLILLGDTIVECDLHRFVAAGDFVLGLRQVDDPRRFGIAETSNNQVVRLEEKPEKPKTNLAVIGLYYFRDARLLRTELKALVDSGRTTRGEVQLTDALQTMIEKGTICVPYEVEHWYDCGKKETILETNRHILERTGGAPTVKDSVIIPPVYLASTAKIVNSVLGPYVSISDGATVKQSIIRNSIIGDNATVDKIIMEDSLVGHEAIVRGESRLMNIGDSSEISPA